jgi:aspartate aminotransferase
MPRLVADRPVLTMTSELAKVMAAAKEREAAGERVLHLERGEPDFDTPPHVVEALAAAARAGETHYPDARGTLALRRALVEKLARENRIACDVDDVVVTCGGTHGLFCAFQALLGAGDEVLVLSPHWMAIPKLVAFCAGATMRTLPAYLEILEGRWLPEDFGRALRAALRPATRGIYLNSPNNPTGAVLGREYLAVLAEVAIERDLWVVSDEAYEHILFDDTEHVSVAALPGMAGRTVSVYTYSKSYAMTGWRIGYVVTPPALRQVLGPILTFYTTHGLFPAAQTAACAATSGSQDAVESMRRSYEERRDALTAGLAGQTAVRVPTPKGAFYAFPDVAGAMSGDIWALVEEWLAMGVAVLPGTAFGAEYGTRVRLSLATRREDIEEGARRITERVRAAAGAR